MTERTESYTVGDLINSMKRVVERHLIHAEDRERLLALSETSWIQLACGAMGVMAGRIPRSEGMKH
jgi:hypothetical protein